ncbi:MAG TPA: hypothetical protein ENJ44_05920 [Oceanospirillales bacterium]|nr:hypothetical protein [Oceanospirillales bacterium]
MNQLLLFGLEVIISLCLGTVTLWLLSQPLVNVLGACRRIENLLQKSWICAISRFFSSNRATILFKKAKNCPKPNFPSLRFLFLDKLLEDLCPTKKQAAFWLAYTRIMLLIPPLLLVLAVSILNNTSNNIDTIKISLGSALAGLLLGMIIVGKKIFEPVNKQCGLE